jgi:predicted nuclease of restriction endonuclease-like (RecB) superfamily
MIKVQTYERLGSKDKQNSLPVNINTVKNDFDEIYKDPYILEFLNLPELVSGEESKLEIAIINNLQKFLLELGRGFSFVGRQFRLNLEGDFFFVDLVFYNIPLKCYVIIELKTTKATHSNLGQLQMYVNYFDRFIKDENDNKTIGILLCSSKNNKLVEITLPEDNTNIYASKYELFLPNKKELENIINEIE